MKKKAEEHNILILKEAQRKMTNVLIVENWGIGAMNERKKEEVEVDNSKSTITTTQENLQVIQTLIVITSITITEGKII